MTACPTPEKGRYRSQAEAKKAQRRRYAGYGRQKQHLYPYECPSGEHWHLTHHTPEKQMATFDKNTKGAGLVATSNMFEDSNVRHVFTDQPLWLGRDICEAVGISKYRDAIAQLDADERVSVVVDTLGGPQNMVAVTEAGVWSLLLISRSPKVKPFKRWLTHEVLPSIRKTGQYGQASNIALPDRSTLAQWVIEAEARLGVAEAKVAELEPKAEFYDELMDADGTYSFLAVSKMIGWGRNIMMAELRKSGVLQKNNLPYQRYEHHFKVTPQTFINRKTGETVPTATTSVWPSGIEFIRKKLAQTSELMGVTA
ncbi:phage antirepressor [Mycobacteroides abscessus]|uniref:phage antirepressor n=2 Tax=Mycobacteroides abscessus TaxID=36809 RepID=UPI0009A64736|nr:phage antirepressor KilAC domain-containing protein [Mycobacteroides abscessus]SKS40213.1 gp54 protein [Mycobacteroides abscessus subsp. massiliense]SKS89672.1 gp54 protein [Mycobacteroides abscessus subsp. massiliense]SKT23791.1 gp54 protein [Mycobacteroides abscessus subsp. massiliense]SKT52219.1 gp54 protein [Mycobacteroides abscessus subsp. massiliense]SKT90913.1 gp54 protein [Mycobacteroides abscessus subsp. massiliense]